MEEPENEDQRHRANMIVLMVVIVLVAGTTWLVIKYKESSARLDCVMAGHHNCDPIEIPASQ